MFANLLNLSLLALALPITTLANYHGNPILNRNPHHRSVARRADGHVDLFKRVTGARWSFYNVETGNALVPLCHPIFCLLINAGFVNRGSCGQFHKNSDFVCFENVLRTLLH
jgi:hypothetical protein